MAEFFLAVHLAEKTSCSVIMLQDLNQSVVYSVEIAHCVHLFKICLCGMGQNAYAPVTLKNHISMLHEI